MYTVTILLNLEVEKRIKGINPLMNSIWNFKTNL